MHIEGEKVGKSKRLKSISCFDTMAKRCELQKRVETTTAAYFENLENLWLGIGIKFLNYVRFHLRSPTSLQERKLENCPSEIFKTYKVVRYNNTLHSFLHPHEKSACSGPASPWAATRTCR